MIYDKLSMAKRYEGASEKLDKAFSFLKTAHLLSLPVGEKVDIDGEDVFARHFSYETAVKTDESRFEDHEEYLDIHYVLSGKERIEVADSAGLRCTAPMGADDYAMYEGKAQYTFDMEAGAFLIVYPTEAHIPKLAAGAPCAVEKIVVKVRV